MFHNVHTHYTHPLAALSMLLLQKYDMLDPNSHIGPHGYNVVQQIS